MSRLSFTSNLENAYRNKMNLPNKPKVLAATINPIYYES